MPKKRFYSRYNLVLIISFIYLLISILLRILLWWKFNLEEESFLLIIPMVGIGFINDFIQLIYLTLPFSFLLFILPNQWTQKRFIQRLILLCVYFSLFGILWLSVAEFYFFDEFDARFNLVAVDYLRYPHEVFVNIWESYPVAWALIINFAISGLLLYVSKSAIYQGLIKPILFKQRSKIFITHIILVIAISGLFSTHSFDFSTNRVLNEITINGASSFFQALQTNQLNYPQYYQTKDINDAFRLLTRELAKGGGQFTHLNEKRLQRKFTTNPKGLGKLNVIIIVEESFGAEFVGSYGDKRQLTPEFDKLAKQGMLFTQAWATGTRTVRGLEAITLSFPPLPGESVIKQPGNENMANWGKIMQNHGYHVSFLYGGYGYFDNMNDFYSQNGFAVSDRSDVPAPNFSNIWGVSDEDLFFHAIHYYNQLHTQQHPFFSIVMTTSNHKPFTFPDGIAGIPTHGGGREAGMRYADYALGKFFTQAQQQTWFENTLFVIVADHGARVYGKAEIPLYSYEIPLLILAPTHIQPTKITRDISQIDIAPTVLGLLGLAYEAPFFGQNVFNLPAEQPTILLFNHNYTVALSKENELAILDLHYKTLSEHYHPETHNFTTLEPPDKSQIDLAIAYYQIAFEQFKHHLYQ